MGTIQLIAGDNRLSLRRLIDQGVRVHSVVTDPPYGLVSVQKRFGKEGSAAARTEGNDGSFARLSGGFMGKAWDGTGIERDPEFWRLVWEILLPGGYVFAFSGSRTGHWQACAMEQAGFIMHPMHGWCFGSGFPKAHAADKAIDKMLGVEREVIGERDPRSLYDCRERESSAINTNWRDAEGRTDSRDLSKQIISHPGSPEAAQWEGWAYGTQTQKPALEPIYLGQKPFSEKTGAANLLMHGVGAVNIDGCRVPTAGEIITTHSRGGSTASPSRPTERTVEESGRITRQDLIAPNPREGRHPANLILDGSPEVVAMFPNTKSGKPGIMRKGTNDGACYGAESRAPGTPMTGFGDEGSAARFFHNFPPDMDPLFYHTKAGKADRAGSRHPTVKPIALMQYLVRHITPPGGTVLDPFAGSGTTAEAARREGFDSILMEAEKEYIDFIQQRFPETAPADDDLLGDLITDDDPLGELLDLEDSI